jgi:hypothetical protein
MSNITRRQLRRIIREEAEIVSGLIQEMVTEAGRWMSAPARRQPRRLSLPTAVDIDTDTEVDEVPPEEEHIDDPPFFSGEWARKREREMSSADSEDDSWYDLPELHPAIPDDHPSLASGPGGDLSEMFGLGNYGAQDRAYRQEKLKRKESARARLRAELQKRKLQRQAPPMYEGPISETRKKKAAKKKDSKQDENQLNTSGKYWYLGTLDNSHEPDLDWSKFGFAPIEEEEE